MAAVAITIDDRGVATLTIDHPPINLLSVDVFIEIAKAQNTSLADLLADRRAAFPSSGEINYRLDDAEAAVDRVVAALEPEAQGRDDTDGVGLHFGTWRLNLRRSNTEPLLRLNVEARGDAALVTVGVARVEALIKG